MSAGAHTLALALLVLLPILWPEALIDRPETDYLRVLIYDPPPPPPPPLPKGSPDGGRTRPRVPSMPKPPEPTSPLEARLEAPIVVVPQEPDPTALTSETAGSPTGSASGVPEGMEGGVEGGMVGGVPGGVLGGVIGGTGSGPVPVRDYDLPPRLLRQTKPSYPSEAFVKRVEGVVVVEILIDSAGHVARARVIRSVPLLDAAALEAVHDWVFSPAVKHGRAVATIVHAPVSFRIY